MADNDKPFLVRLELAFLDWVITNGGTPLDDLRDAGKIFSAHQTGDEPELPYLAIMAGPSTPFGDMPAETLVKSVPLTWHLKTAAMTDDGEAGADSAGDPGGYPASRNESDPVLVEIDRLMNDLKATIITALNKPNGTDTRTYGAIHIYDILPGEQVGMGDASHHWHEQATWDLVCQACNGPDPGA